MPSLSPNGVSHGPTSIASCFTRIFWFLELPSMARALSTQQRLTTLLCLTATTTITPTIYVQIRIHQPMHVRCYSHDFN
jgi:hypothetical protein